MIGLDIKIVDTSKIVVEAANAAAFKNVGHAGATIRKDAIASITTSDEKSMPGTPPHTRKGSLPRSIAFAAEDLEAIVGPRESIAGDAGHLHEFGGTGESGEQFDERSFMEPALERNLARFGESFANSIGQ